MEKQSHAAIAVTAEVDRREDDAAARSFATDCGVHRLHHLDDVRLADRRAIDLAAELRRRCRRSRRMSSGSPPRRPAAAPAPPRPPAPARRRCPARGRLVDHGQPVAVRILREADVAVLSREPAPRFRQAFRASARPPAGKGFVGIDVDGHAGRSRAIPSRNPGVITEPAPFTASSATRNFRPRTRSDIDVLQHALDVQPLRRFEVASARRGSPRCRPGRTRSGDRGRSVLRVRSC